MGGGGFTDGGVLIVALISLKIQACQCSASASASAGAKVFTSG